MKGASARPSVRAPDARVPAELEALCVAATAREETDRPPSARALHDVIEAFLDGDRDLELRRALSRKHASIAVESAAALESRRSDTGAVERRDALRGVGQALALDPKNRVALETLVHLLRSPPRRPPAEVERAQQHLNRALLVRAGALGALCYFLSFLATLVLHTQQVLEPSSLLSMELAWCAAAVAGVVTMRRPSYPSLVVMFVLGTGSMVWALRSVMGPFAVVPSGLAMHGVLYSLSRVRHVRLMVLAGVCIAWTIAVFGEPLGLLPVTTTFGQGHILVTSPLVELSPAFARGFLYVTVLAVIAIPTLVAGRLRAAQARADDETKTLMWQLQQLLPDEALADP
jgi:serine/threonine-protein kinase